MSITWLFWCVITVGLVGYGSFKKKTYISNDEALLTQMNTIVFGYEALDEKARNMSEPLNNVKTMVSY